MQASPKPEPPARRGVAIKLGLSLLLAAAFVIALRPYLDTVPSDLSISPAVIALYLASLLPYHLLRAGRWRLLLAPLGGERLPGLVEVTRIGLAGYMWIALMPFRLGEFARPVFLAQRSDLKVSTSLGTVAIERAVDGILVCALFFIAMAFAEPQGDTQTFYIASMIVMAAFSGALLGMLAAARWPSPVAATARGMLRFSPKFADWAEQTVYGVAQGFRALPNPVAIGGFVVTSIGYWLANAVGMWILAHGCGLALTPFEAVATLAIMNLALLIPGGPAQLGVFQTGVAAGLHLFLPGDTVMAAGSRFAFYLYVCQLSTIVLLGLGSQWSLKLNWRAALAVPRVEPADSCSK